MCKILTVVVAFLWALANSTFLGRDSLPLVLIYGQTRKFHQVVCKSVLHVNGNHWITITTLMNCIDSHCDIVVYDSLYAYVS